MAYVVIARWKFPTEDVAQLSARLQALAEASRREPGCLSYVPHRGATDPTSIAIVEQYRDEAAFQAHVASEHFVRIARGEIIPKLVERTIEFFEPL
jgi:quinol monooxygenase YgiN